MVKWTEDELDELNKWAGSGDKGMTCPWRVVAECVNREFGNERSPSACQQRWWKYTANDDLLYCGKGQGGFNKMNEFLFIWLTAIFAAILCWSPLLLVL